MTLPRKTPLARVSAKKLAENAGRMWSTLRRAVPNQREPRKPLPKQRNRGAVPAKVRKSLAERSGGRCELNLPGCLLVATDPCHRVKHGMGGRKGVAKEHHDRLSNVLHGCRSCHDWCHANPDKAYRLGQMLREWQLPEQVPVWTCHGLVLLDNDGGRTVTSAGVDR